MKGLFLGGSLTAIVASLCWSLSTSGLTSLAVLVALVVFGSWQLGRWGFPSSTPDPQPSHQTAPYEFGPAEFGPGEFDDECELAAFTALQAAWLHVDVARAAILRAGGPMQLWDAYVTLEVALHAFVFGDNGLGDLAAAWSLEEQALQLVEQATAHGPRPTTRSRRRRTRRARP